MRIQLVGYTVPGSGVKGMGLGISRYVYYLGKNLVEMGHDVNLVVRDDFRPRERWISTAHSPKFSWYAYPFFLKSQLKSAEADVFNSDYVVTGVPLASLGKRPLVVTLHDALPFHEGYGRMHAKDKLFINFFRYCFDRVKDRCDAIVMRSEHARQDMIDTTGVDENKVFVVSGGLDTEYFYPKKRREHDKVRIGYKGGLDGRKNAELLVNVFKRLVKERNDVELHVAGAGPSLERFRAMNIPNAKFYGYIPDSQENDFLNSLDVYVYPTLGEGLGLGPLEAMGCGVPVLASDTTSMPEVVGGAGITTKPTVGDFHRELTRLVDSAALRKKIGKACLQRAQTMTWRRTAEDSLEVYEAVV